MGFNGTRDLILANQDGRTHFCSFRKAPSQASSALGWVDLSMAAGNPLPQYYAAAPLEAARLDGLRGIFHGADKAPATMHLTDWHAAFFLACNTTVALSLRSSHDCSSLLYNTYSVTGLSMREMNPN